MNIFACIYSVPTVPKLGTAARHQGVLASPVLSADRLKEVFWERRDSEGFSVALAGRLSIYNVIGYRLAGSADRRCSSGSTQMRRVSWRIAAQSFD